MFARLVVVGRASSVYSCEPKKYSFRVPPFPLRLSISPGMTTGPPIPYPEMFTR
jgi:hypothetical protein